MLALKHPNALLSIDVDGARPQLALAKQVQRDPVKGFIEHADLLAVRQGEKVTVDIPVIVVGTAASDTLVVTETAQLSVLSEATHLPDSVEVSVEGVAAGTQIHAGDLQLPEGTTLAGDADVLIVNVVAAQSAEAAEAELAEAEADAGIERDESTADDDTTVGDESDEESSTASEE
jgi:large subunit ribosomal protein L25